MNSTRLSINTERNSRRLRFAPRWTTVVIVVLGLATGVSAAGWWEGSFRPAWRRPEFLAQQPTLAPPRSVTADPNAYPAQMGEPIAAGAPSPMGYAPAQANWQAYPGGMPSMLGVDSAQAMCDPRGWGAAQQIDFQAYGPGEYVGHARSAHVPEYRLRVDDQLELVFRITRNEQSRPYELNVGDEVRIEAVADATLNRDLIIQPDGTITLRLVGQVKATRHTVPQLREEIEELYRKYYKEPSITVTPLKVNTKLEDLRATVDRRQGFGGQSREAKVTPEGTISLPAIGAVQAQGLTLAELKQEIDSRYALEVEGLEVTPMLLQRAPRYVYVLGEVRIPGRYTLEGPTTVMQTLSLAGGWNVGGNLRQVVVFRRADDWRLLATMLDIRGALYGKVPAPSDEIWINDADIVVVPKAPIRVFDDYVNLIFTQGLYQIVPFSTSVNFSFLNTLTPAAGVSGT